ncbi:MAG TPA: universal stress protein [Terrimicrobiaceae bacterium]
MKNLLVLVDFSDASILIVKKAAELAQELSARIVLMHIVEPRVVLPPVGDTKSPVGVAAAWPLQNITSRSVLKRHLNSLAFPLRSLGVPVKCVAVVGFLVDEILRQSAKYHAAYIILGSRGHKGAHHLVTRNVFTGKQQLTCPMIVFPVKGGAS